MRMKWRFLYFVYIYIYLENMKALPLTVWSNEFFVILYITKLGIWFWELSVCGLPYGSSTCPSVFHLPLLTRRDRSEGSRPGRTVSTCSIELTLCGLQFCLLAPVIPHFRMFIRWSHFWLLWGSFYLEGSLEVEELIVLAMGKDYVTVLLSVIYDIEIWIFN